VRSEVEIIARLAALALPAFGQDFKESFGKHWKTSAAFTIAVANAMPAAHYGFAPNAEEMNFGQLMMHIAKANNGTFARVAGLEAPKVPEKIAAAGPKGVLEKEAVVQFLTDSFAFCSDALSKATREQLAAASGPEGRQLTGAERVWAYFTHTAHHRGQVSHDKLAGLDRQCGRGLAGLGELVDAADPFQVGQDVDLFARLRRQARRGQQGEERREAQAFHPNRRAHEGASFIHLEVQQLGGVGDHALFGHQLGRLGAA
jgi:uncharacterized damage-inducible protein DinB